MIFAIIFVVLLVMLGGLILVNFSGKSFPKTNMEFFSFQLTYLVPFLMMKMSDWLQGPYIYALYSEEYNFGIGMIAILFIFGFMSSMLFGTIIGSLSDKFGRKLCCVIFCIAYILSCITKHFNNFGILLVGRILGGIATSILFSSFESWMVHEHFDKKFDEKWLSATFTWQVFFDGIVAIVAGLIAKIVTDLLGTKVAPFDTANLFLGVGMIIIIVKWSENYGDSTGNVAKSFVEGFKVLLENRAVLYLGLAQSMFEAGMYNFVFIWTPVLNSNIVDYSHGMVFSIYMICVMMGSMVFNVFSSKIRLEYLLTAVFALSILSMFVPVVFINNGWIVFVAFNVFEFCVGMFWPSISTLKSSYIPEEVRSTIMNYFRIPTNFFVIGTLIFAEILPTRVVFLICTVCMAVSLYSMLMIIKFYLPEKMGVSEVTEEGHIVEEDEVEDVELENIGEKIDDDDFKEMEMEMDLEEKV